MGQSFWGARLAKERPHFLSSWRAVGRSGMPRASWGYIYSKQYRLPREYHPHTRTTAVGVNDARTHNLMWAFVPESPGATVSRGVASVLTGDVLHPTLPHSLIFISRDCDLAGDRLKKALQFTVYPVYR